MKYLIILIVAIILDLIFGDPHSIPHPVVYIGRWISFLERNLRKIFKNNLYLAGFFLLVLTLCGVSVFILLIRFLTINIHPLMWDIICTYGIYTALAGKCLSNEVKRVLRLLKEKGIEESRGALSYLVGRDTKNLTEESVLKALLETTAENTIDGVLAPMFYILVGFFLGYPLLIVYIYKAVNTLDSMVGYKQEPFLEIGFCSAKFDDVLNFIPARFGSIEMLIGSLFLKLPFKRGLKIFLRDRKNHKSPNSAHPESVVAGLLDIQLGGNNVYFGELVKKKTIGDNLDQINHFKVKKTIQIMYASAMVQVVISMILLLRW